MIVSCHSNQSMNYWECHFKTNVSKKQGFVDHNLDHKKVLAFMSLQKF